MIFPAIKPDRALLVIALRADETVAERYAALRAVLKVCRLHPLDTTPASEIVIVEEAAFRARLAEVRATLGADDLLHLVTLRPGGRLGVEAITAPDVDDPLGPRPPARRPPWLRD